MERLKIPWGVQFELARGVLAERWTWEHVTESVLERLKGSNAQAAPRINAVMSGTAPRTDSSKTKLDLW
jgi:RNA-dependent RNA polymerase